MNLDLFNKIMGENVDLNIQNFKREIANKLEKMDNLYTLDRFEGEFAVLEDRNTGKMINVKKEDLPQNAKEGSILKMNNNNKYEIDLNEQEKIEKRIQEKMNKLWK